MAEFSEEKAKRDIRNLKIFSVVCVIIALASIAVLVYSFGII